MEPEDEEPELDDEEPELLVVDPPLAVVEPPLAAYVRPDAAAGYAACVAASPDGAEAAACLESNSLRPLKTAGTSVAVIEM